MKKGESSPAVVLALRDQLMASFASKKDRLLSISEHGPRVDDEKDVALCQMLALFVLAELSLGIEGVEGLARDSRN